MLNRFFNISQAGSTIRTEMLAGLTTFVTMSYIVFINPALLAQTGMDKGAVFTATCLAAAFGSAVMGLLANYPIALAPGMALNTYFTFGVVLGAGYSWQTALGAVFVAGVIFFVLSILPVRQFLVNSMPKSLKVAIVAGIGLFLGVIGLKSAGIIKGSTATLVTLGDLHQPSALLAIIGFFLIIGMDALNVAGGILISILTVTLIGMLLGFNHFNGIFSLPEPISPTFMQMDLTHLWRPDLFTIIFAFLFVDLFDNSGTLIGVAHRAGFIDAHGRLPRINRALAADSLAAVASAIFGTSTTTSYLESTVGVKVGGRTGLVAVVVALLFLVMLFFAPLASSIPIYATAPALVYVACMMARAFTEFDWEDVTEYAPSVITAIAMPLTFSIAEGISLGFITYTAVKMISGKWRDLNATVIVLTCIFVVKYIFIT